MKLIHLVCCFVLGVTLWAADYEKLSQHYKVTASELVLLVDTCNKYVTDHNLNKEMKDYNKKLEDRIQQKIQDSDCSIEAAFQQYSLDWLADNSKKIESKDTESIKKAVFMFIYFMEKEILLPGQLRERFTSENLNKLVKYLKEQKKE